MSALVGALAALDRHSLATKRPITVPLLRAWLQHDIDLDPDGARRFPPDPGCQPPHGGGR